MADAEVIVLAAQALSLLGVGGFRLELADLDVLNSILDAIGLSERARAFTIVNMPKLSEGPDAVPHILEEARRLNVTTRSADDDYLGQAIEGLTDDKARIVLRGLLEWNSSDQWGQRNPDEVVDRLLRKLRGSDTEESLKRGLKLAGELASVNGEPKYALDSAKSVVRAAGASESPIQRLSNLMELVSSEPLPWVWRKMYS